MSHLDVPTRHGVVGMGDVWVVRKSDGTKAVLHIGDTHDDFFHVSQLLPSLDLKYEFTLREFEKCTPAKRLDIVLSPARFEELVEDIRRRGFLRSIEQAYRNL